MGRVQANLGVEMIYALSAPAKGRVERLAGSVDSWAGEQGQAHNKRFAIAAQDTQPALRKAPSDHTQRLDLCALHYLRKVYKNHTVRLHGRVIDIPKRPDSAYATYTGKNVVVKHLLSGDYRAFYGEECIAWANGEVFNRHQPEQRQERTVGG